MKTTTEKTTITRDQYLKGQALLYMGQRTLERLHEIEIELTSVLGVEADPTYGHGVNGHVSDAIFNEYKFRTLLDKLNLKS